MQTDAYYNPVKWATEFECEVQRVKDNFFYGTFCKKIFTYGLPNIDRIFVNKKKKTIVIKWNDGVRTKVKCAKDDTWNVEAGINAAVIKRIIKSNNAYYKDIHKKIEYQD